MIRRKIMEDVEAHLKRPEITLILGPRQVGKTTLMKMLIEKLKRSGERVIYFNLDFEEDMRYFESQSMLISKIKLEIGDHGYVFIDEIQRKENAGLFLKGIYDMGLKYKFVVSGSGSFELKEKLSDSLVGRKRIFLMTPVTFEEFVDYKTGYRYSNNMYDFFKVETNRSLELLKEYMIFGGYPKVVTLETKGEKVEELKEIFTSYIEKDVSNLLRVHKVWEFSQLVRILSQLSGRIVVYSNLSVESGISVKTLKEYLWYLEKTFIIRLIPPYYRNKMKELSKSPVCYFVDLGLRNYADGEIVREYVDGFVFQNFVLNELINAVDGYTIHYYRTKNMSEVDFVLRKGLEIIPVEVKYKRLSEPKAPRSLKSFINKYSPKRAFVVNLNLESEVKIGETIVKFVPFYGIRKIISL